MSELLKDEKHIINLGGEDYELSPINLNVLSAFEAEFGCGLDKLGEMVTKAQATTLRSLIWILLKDKYDLSKEQIGSMVDMKNIESIVTRLTEAMK